MADYNIAIARRPNVIRRTAMEREGDAVLGFALTITDQDEFSCRIQCDMVRAGSITPSGLHACLDALCQQYGHEAVTAAVRTWLHESDIRRGGAVPCHRPW